ncbi:MAG TPA: septation protein SepH [Acidimicrobiia bacterium]
MQKLHVIGLSKDGSEVLLATRRNAKNPKYSIPLVEARRAADEHEAEASIASGSRTPLLDRAVAHRESLLSVREVQDLLRAGWSVSRVAGHAGVEPEWVERFSAPVEAEQGRVIDQAQQMVFIKRRVGPSARPLGESVTWNLAEKGIRLTGRNVIDAWSAVQRPSGAWAVRVTYTNRGRDHQAEWELDPHDGLTASNAMATRLAYVEPGRRRPRLPDPQPEAESSLGAEAKPTTRAKRTAKRKPVTPAGKRPAKRRPAIGKKPAKRKPAKKRPSSRRAPAAKRQAKKAARPQQPKKRAAARVPKGRAARPASARRVVRARADAVATPVAPARPGSVVRVRTDLAPRVGEVRSAVLRRAHP